mgnify:CR=1 FL=1
MVETLAIHPMTKTFVSSSSYFNDTVLKRSFIYNGNVLEYGMPRNDVFFKNTLDVNSTELVLGEYGNVWIHREPNTLHFGGVSFDIIPWIENSSGTKKVEGYLDSWKNGLCSYLEYLKFIYYKKILYYRSYFYLLIAVLNTVCSWLFSLNKKINSLFGNFLSIYGA